MCSEVSLVVYRALVLQTGNSFTDCEKEGGFVQSGRLGKHLLISLVYGIDYLGSEEHCADLLK